MKKAIIAALMTVLIGWFFADWLYQLPEAGVIIAIAVMGGCIIYFNEQKK
nr:binding-protein-dependent transport permease [uncultured Oscillibacter sp.]